MKIIGASSAFSREASDDEKTVAFIREEMKKHDVSSIDILFVAYAPLWQEKWVVRNSRTIPARVSIGVGRVFDYVTGYMKPSPKLVSMLHLEWLYSFFAQPWRYKRVLLSFPLFPLKVFLASIKSLFS